MSLISRVNWAKLTSDDKQQIDSRLRAIISLRREELSKLFVYGHTKVVISVKVNLSQHIIEIKFNLPAQKCYGSLVRKTESRRRVIEGKITKKTGRELTSAHFCDLTL